MRTKIEKLQDALTEVCNKYDGFNIERNDISNESIVITRNTNLFTNTATTELAEAANLLHAEWYIYVDNNQVKFRAYYL